MRLVAIALLLAGSACARVEFDEVPADTLQPVQNLYVPIIASAYYCSTGAWPESLEDLQAFVDLPNAATSFAVPASVWESYAEAAFEQISPTELVLEPVLLKRGVRPSEEISLRLHVEQSDCQDPANPKVTLQTL